MGDHLVPMGSASTSGPYPAGLAVGVNPALLSRAKPFSSPGEYRNVILLQRVSETPNLCYEHL